jgi:hypothetical protein
MRYNISSSIKSNQSFYFLQVQQLNQSTAIFSQILQSNFGLLCFWIFGDKPIQ